MWSLPRSGGGSAACARGGATTHGTQRSRPPKRRDGGWRGVLRPTGTDDVQCRAARRLVGAGGSHGRLRGCPSAVAGRAASGDAVDARTLRFLVARSLAEKKEEEEEQGKAEFAQQVEELRQEEKEEKEEDSPILFLLWPRSSSTTAVVCSWLVTLVQFSAFAVSLSFVGRSVLPGIMDGMDQYNSFHLARRRPRHWLMLGWFFWNFTSRCVPSCCRQAPRCSASCPLWTRRRTVMRSFLAVACARFGLLVFCTLRCVPQVVFSLMPCIMAGMDQRDSFVAPQLQFFQIVAIPVVMQRPIPTVLLTAEIPQLHFLDKVIDVPVCMSCRFFQLLPVVCNDRCPPQLQFVYKVVIIPFVAQRLFP